MTAMLMLSRAKFSPTLPGAESYSTVATKMLRTYTAQLETLAKLRRKGEQVVRVEHVHVYPGGQAIVGSITTGVGGGFGGNGQQPHAPGERGALAYAPGTEVRGSDQIRDAMPQSSNSAPKAMPHARRRERKRSA